jgi:hypothetical protein
VGFRGAVRMMIVGEGPGMIKYGSSGNSLKKIKINSEK